MRALCIRLTALLALVLAPLAVRAQQLSERVPDDAMLFVSWQGTEKMQPAYQASHLKAVLDATTVADFVQKKLPEILQRVGGADEEQAAVQKQLWEVFGTMGKYPTGLYIGALDPAGPPMPRVALICDAGKDSVQLEKTVGDLLVKAGPAPIPLSVKRSGGVVALLVGQLGEGAEGILLGNGAAASGTLSTNKAFVAAMGQVSKNPVLTVYVNVPGIVKVADTAAKMNPDSSEAWPKIRDAMNLGGVREVVFTAGFEGKDWSQQVFVAISGPRTGVLSLLDGTPIGDDQLKLIPASATWAAAFRTDLAKLWNDVFAGIAKGSPEAAEQTRRGLVEINDTLGMDIEKDLLSSLGDQWVAYTSPTVGGTGLTGITIINVAKDSAKLSKAIDTLEAVANKAIDENTNRGFRSSFEPRISIQRTKITGVDVHYISLFFVNPSWTVHEGKLYVSLMPQSIPAAIDAASAKTSILDNPGFTAMRSRLGVDKPTSIQFIDLPKTAPDSYPMLSTIIGLAGMFAGPDASPALLPPLHKLLPELSPAGAASWTDAAGWHMKSISPLPGSVVFSGQQSMMAGGVAAPAMMVAIMLPSLGRARTLSNRSYEAANERGVVQSAIVWSAEHNDDMPEHLAQLIVAQQISPRQLVSKESGTKPAEISAEKMEEAKKDWHAIEKIIDEHCDYVYVGKGTKNLTDSTMILLYAKPTLPGAREGMTIAFGDCHAEFVRAGGLKSVFEQSNQARKAAGYAELDVITAPAGPPPSTRGR